jgi:hypothetical protein
MAISRLSRLKKKKGENDSSDEEDQPLIKDGESYVSKKGWKKKLKGLRGTTQFSESNPSMTSSSIKSPYLTGASRSRRDTIKDALDKAVNVENDIPSSERPRKPGVLRRPSGLQKKTPPLLSLTSTGTTFNDDYSLLSLRNSEEDSFGKWGQSSFVSLLSEHSNDQPLPKPLKPPSQRSLKVLNNATNRSTESPKSNGRQVSPSRPKPLRRPSLHSIQSTSSSNGSQALLCLKPRLLKLTSILERTQKKIHHPMPTFLRNSHRSNL